MNRRLERAAELIKRELGAVIAKILDLGGAFITLTRVIPSDDLQYADVYFTVIPDRQVDEAEKNLRKNIFFIQQALNKRLRMRPVPKIIFHKDEAEFEAAKLDELLKRI